MWVVDIGKNVPADCGEVTGIEEPHVFDTKEEADKFKKEMETDHPAMMHELD